MTWNRLVKSDTEVVTSVTTSFVSAKFSGSGQRETPSEQSCQNSEVGKSLLTSSISDVRTARERAVRAAGERGGQGGSRPVTDFFECMPP